MRSAWAPVCRRRAAGVIYDSATQPSLSQLITLISRKRSVALLPMALVIALHLALLLVWISAAHVSVERSDRQRYFTLTWLRPPTPPAPPPSPRRQKPVTTAARPVAAPVASAPQPAAAEAFALEQAPRDDPPPALDVHQLKEAARQQAGAIDHALRGGKLDALAPDRDLPIVRLRAALESAYVDRSRTMVTESMTQADGVVVYRFRRGEKVWCRQSGGIGPGIERSDGARLAGAGSGGGAGTAGTIPCPNGETGWSRL